jgi:hypothetical protein
LASGWFNEREPDLTSSETAKQNLGSVAASSARADKDLMRMSFSFIVSRVAWTKILQPAACTSLSSTIS